MIETFCVKPRERLTHDLSQYRISVVGNHAFFPFLRVFLNSLLDNQIKCKELWIGNGGLKDEEIRWIETRPWKYPVLLLDMLYQNDQDEIEHQGDTYQKIVVSRAQFWDEVLYRDRSLPMAHFDADTAIISNDFSMLDNSQDMTVSTRYVLPHMHPENRFDADYINLGTVFIHRTENVRHMLKEYRHLIERESDRYSIEQFDQPCFYKAMNTFLDNGHLTVQRLHCRYYNCFEPSWWNDRTSVLHFKNFHNVRGSNADFEARIRRFVKDRESQSD